ncbi:MAG: hypothetical protein AAF253_14590 [Pseudomonadota bacterium]
MEKTASMIGLTLLMLALMDAGVAAVLHTAEAQGRLGGLVQYFEYGRSVPGKLQRWKERPDMPGNLYEVAWRRNIIADSAEDFAGEVSDASSTVRAYGMSFVNNILRQAVELDSDLGVDIHSGPAAPPNFTYALFLEDRTNRRPGDIVVLGVLASSIPAMAAMSNRSWLFEQPAPFTYPVFRPSGDELERIDPLVSSAAEERALAETPKHAAAWRQQMAEEDAFASPFSFGAPVLDHSPFARLARRSLAIGHIDRTERNLLASERLDLGKTLRRLIHRFAEIAREDGQSPMVFLIQTRDPSDADILAMARPALERYAIPYLATAEHFDPRDPAGFLDDGHYRVEVDRLFAERFLQMLVP